MDKQFENFEILQYFINEKAKEDLTESDLHKTPLYEDEYFSYLKKFEEYLIRKQEKEKELWLINYGETYKSKSRNLIKKFKP